MFTFESFDSIKALSFSNHPSNNLIERSALVSSLKQLFQRFYDWAWAEFQDTVENEEGERPVIEEAPSRLNDEEYLPKESLFARLKRRLFPYKDDGEERGKPACEFCYEYFDDLTDRGIVKPHTITYEEVVYTHERLLDDGETVLENETSVMKQFEFAALCEDCCDLLGTNGERLEFYKIAMRKLGVIEGSPVWQSISHAAMFDGMAA